MWNVKIFDIKKCKTITIKVLLHSNFLKCENRRSCYIDAHPRFGMNFELFEDLAFFSLKSCYCKRERIVKFLIEYYECSVLFVTREVYYYIKLINVYFLLS